MVGAGGVAAGVVGRAGAEDVAVDGGRDEAGRVGHGIRHAVCAHETPMMSAKSVQKDVKEKEREREREREREVVRTEERCVFGGEVDVVHMKPRVLQRV